MNITNVIVLTFLFLHINNGIFSRGPLKKSLSDAVTTGFQNPYEWQM